MQPLMVHENPKSFPAPSADSTTASVRYCCCFKKGDATLSSMFDKNIYCLGETANVLTDCDNRSTVGVRKCAVATPVFTPHTRSPALP